MNISCSDAIYTSHWHQSVVSARYAKCSPASTGHLQRRLRQTQNITTCAVTVYFKEEDVVIDADPRENIVQVAERAGVVIETGCNTGSCGICEVEVRKLGGAGTDVDGAPAVVRACIAAIPPGYSRIEIAPLGDAIWGSDGWET